MPGEEDHKRDEGARTKAATTGIVAKQGKIGGELKFSKNSAFLKERIGIWDELMAKQVEVYKGYDRNPIKITLPDGNVKEGTSFESTPFSVAKAISSQMAKTIIVAKVKYSTKRAQTLDEGLINPEAEAGVAVDDQWYFWDVSRPLEGDCELRLIKFEDPEGKETFWHSSAHVLGETLEEQYGVQLCHGPPTEEGFFYDSYSGSDIFHEKDYKDIEKAAAKIVSSAQTFSRLVLTKEEALRLFGSNPFKVSTISGKIEDGGKVTAYRCGSLIDLCTGPHIPSTKIIKAFKVMKNSSAYWLGNAENDSLQRVYGITFPSKAELEEYVHDREEAAKRDHRTIGRAQGLFDMHALSPGCGFMYPKGTHIYNGLMNLIREQYRVRGFQEVISPNIFNLKLWKTSGHYEKYQENIFLLKAENQGFGVKPMNCPAHCLMFANEQRTYKELPVRFADFGVLHRNEISGALSGLTRVRRFCQDDAHQFCTEDQMMDEILGNLDFLDHVYGLFGFRFEMELSTRPEKRLGADELWDKAEAALENALNKFGRPWKLNPGDGAFYGPKIDIKVFDAFKRSHQCGTVQLDFQNPIRFNLQYKTAAVVHAGDNKHEKPIAHLEHLHAGSKTESTKVVKPGVATGEEAGTKHANREGLMSQTFKADAYDCEDFTWLEQHVKPGFQRPVMVHRAILGSVERFMAILIEHTGGKWPFFLSPRQAIICPISEKFSGYCKSVYLYLHKFGYQVEVDESSHTLNKKIRTNQLEQWNFILVAGADEAENGQVDIRTRENKRMGKMRVDELHFYFQTLMPNKSSAFEKFYADAWKVPEGAEACGGSQPAASSEKVKLASNDASDPMAHMVQVVADLSGVSLTTEVSSAPSKAVTGSFPYLETSDGSIICEAEAVAKHVARMNQNNKLLGKNAFEEAKINEWISWVVSDWQVAAAPAIGAIYGSNSIESAAFSEAVKEVKILGKMLDEYLKDKQWLVGDVISIGDLYLGASLAPAFQTILDAGFRKAHPNLSGWFERWSRHQPVVKRHGAIQVCQKSLKPLE